MRTWLPSKYVLLGVSLALMLQTSSRFAGAVGVGELLALLYFTTVLVSGIWVDRRLIFLKPDGFTLFYLGIVILLITPMTLLSSAMATPGSSFRDLAAYFLVCAVLLTLPRAERDVKIMVMAFLCVLFLSITFHYLHGGSSAYYSSRFTGGAKNPNQLALYLAAAVVFSVCLNSNVARFSVVVLAFFFGLMSLSDAFLVFLFVSIAVFVALTIMPPRAVLYALPMLILLFVIVFVFTGLSETFLERWESADEGGGRAQLYISAIYAWLDTPFSMFFGHGAGSYSGINGPFEMAEAHNTVLDFASVAGIFGLLLFPVIPLWMIMRSMSKSYRFAPAVLMGLVAFAFFHFVGRQPVFWVSLVLITRLIQHKPITWQLAVGRK